MKKKTIKKLLSICLGTIGVFLTLFTIPIVLGKKIPITGAVIGTNTNSQVLGAIGIILMLIAVIVERYEIKNTKN
ncbi:hypothetical protein GOV14_00170 [Candidatus Pacearchaeota archaeon]|nr:hypothetical protein [Candidatus Pacearchaeota archaeon]